LILLPQGEKAKTGVFLSAFGEIATLRNPSYATVYLPKLVL
jgi:hypothetical protein